VADERHTPRVPTWLEVTAGLIAVLAFLGITDYHHAATFLGLRKNHPTSAASASPTPVTPEIARPSGPDDPQDVATCESALSDIEAIRSNPPSSDSAQAQFYQDESTSFSGLEAGATNVTLKGYLALVQGATLKLSGDYLHEALSDSASADAAADSAQLAADEVDVETFCSREAGVTRH
jgi:hypothetical protein